MTSIKEAAKEYVSQKTKNISELESVSVDLQLTDRKFLNKKGIEFSIQVANINNEEYRVPASVLKDLKAILEVNPKLKNFRVRTTGTDINTSYTVIPL